MIDVVLPRWEAGPRVRALCTTRIGGNSLGPYHAFNLATHVGDDPRAVALNRQRLREQLELPTEPRWLQQVHGTRLVTGDDRCDEPVADACYSTKPEIVCTVMTADCLPILLCDEQATIVAALHAGWRGLVNGIISTTLTSLHAPGRRWMAWIGPAISVSAYQVGEALRNEFVRIDPGHADYFHLRDKTLWADLPGIAARQLQGAGVASISRYDGCTAGEPERFFSFRRDGVCGRMASLIWFT